MFMGEYSHTVDAKGRLIIPSKFREELGENFVVTRGMDGCLFIYFYFHGLLSECLLVFNVQVFHLLDSFVPKYSTPFDAIVNRKLK